MLTDILNGMDADLRGFTGFNDDDIAKLLDDSKLDELTEDNKKKKDKLDKKEGDEPAQIIVSICDYPLVLADPVKVDEMKGLFNRVKDQPAHVKAAVNEAVFEAMSATLKAKLKETLN